MTENNIQFNWLIGDRIKSVVSDVETTSWIILFQSGVTLRIEAMWRLIEDGTICSTSLDHGHKFGRDKAFDGVAALHEMGQYRIEKVKVCSETGDLFIELGTMFEFQVISTSAGYESWQMIHPTMGEWVASGGEIQKIKEAQQQHPPDPRSAGR